mmetsp:Transcript_53986/g.96684  ORF Transcript_53986/g.96684 Transcript_53986/m.96684 type:complete len:207 (+) Transcript_53986:23-643(+)
MGSSFGFFSDGLDVEPSSWDHILKYANDQAGEAAAGRGPRRSTEVEARYKRYSAWCMEREHTTLQLLLAVNSWRPVSSRRFFAKECRVALEPNIVPYHCDAGIEHWVLWYHPEDTPGSTDLDHDSSAEHVRTFISLQDDELIVFQNLPEFRSVPEIAHAHAFVRPLCDTSAAALQALREERRIRSPWAEAERLGGRGDEWARSIAR